MKKITAYLLILSALIILSCKEKTAMTAKDNTLQTAKKSSTDTSTSNKTIVIEGVKDPRQLQEIFTLLESYSTANKMKDIKIKYLNTKKSEPSK